MADAQASGACGSNIVWVQVPSPASFFYSFLEFWGIAGLSFHYLGFLIFFMEDFSYETARLLFFRAVCPHGKCLCTPIRFYDKQNILKPSYVTPAGARFYTDSDFARLQQILLLKYLGFSLRPYP